MIHLPASALLCLVLVLTVDSEDGKGEQCQGTCPPGWESFRNRCFQYVAQEKPWAEAETECIRLGGNLASVHSEEENTFLVQLIKSKRPYPAWLGGSDCQKEGTWLWSDGSKWDYTKWNPTEPNSSGVENCIHTFWAQLNWNDIACNNRYPFICALRPESVLA
ncbi:lactose-binding lectin l-2-like [Lepisosteus oculatus]|uniref:Lactose-binding lectin l-2-like n=1 Tax=Lepisosteus oculatus TaxID=7918 RepID=W5MQI9_LEPOC|nr:PREDICTED: lactose-binding lectin l-2-like [Lepisosteus oculatus]